MDLAARAHKVTIMSFLRERWEKNWPEMRAALLGGLPHFVLSKQPAELGDSVPVFHYHTVDHEELEADLRFLRRNGYVAINADSLLDHLQGRRPAPERAVVLSFDDGPRHLHQVVFPLLHAFRQPTVAFIAAGFHPDDGAPDVPDRPCTWDELRAMHASGLVDFQSHTFEHRYLPCWPEPVAPTGIASRFLRYDLVPRSIEADFRLAREAIEAQLKKRVQHLAFPRFDGTPEAVRIARACGYLGLWCGLASGQRSNRPGDDGTAIVRVSGEFVRRLPGRDRTSVTTILRRRYASGIRRWAWRRCATADGRAEPADGP
jgi:peptidoglycan/xylan/chitin deacetylase (PgdA/CDA1 family)